MAKTQSVGSALKENTTTSTQTQIIKSLAVHCLNNNELEEQCIHHFNLSIWLKEKFDWMRKGKKPFVSD